jgi:hypothetical protein
LDAEEPDDADQNVMEPGSWVNPYRSPPKVGRVLQDLLHRNSAQREALERVDHIVAVERLFASSGGA